MDTHSFKVLEFDKLREKVAENSYTEKVYNKIMELYPKTDYVEINKELEVLKEYTELSKYDAGLELEGLKDIEFLIEKIELVGTYLSPEEFYDIKKNLRIFRVSKNKIEDLKGKYKNLFNKFKNNASYKGVEELIEKVIDDNKKVKNDASLELKEIRRQKLMINSNIKKKYDELIMDSSKSKMLQEKILTIRDGRYVIPIKADFKGQIKGIEHDRSASGQTVFLEPLFVVSLNNKLRELEVREREEIRKVLLRLTDILRTNLDGIKELADGLLDLDFINSKAIYSMENNCIMPKLNNKEYINLINARHPFIPKNEIVPISFTLGKDYNIMLITGPNTGGKTVALKTAGLLTLMTLSGLLIPADEKTEIGVFNNVFADIGDEQSIEQNLSSFSAHLKNIQSVLDKVNKGSLVLFDELGSGTDPMEGSAFAMAVIDYLKTKKSKVIVSTHYSEVKAHGFNEEGIETASMEFDVESLSPTYKILMGIPGESNALTIARRLGVSEEIIENAKKYISEDDKKIETMIINIREKSEKLDRTNEEVEKLREDAKKLKEEYEEKIYQMEKEKNEIIKDAYKKADDLVKNMQAKAKGLVEKIRKEENKKDDIKQTEKSLNMLRRGLEEEKKQNVKKETKKKKILEAKAGDKVYITSIKQDAIILKINQNKGEAQVQAGILKLMVPFDEIKKLEKEKKKNYIKTNSIKAKRVKSEIDVRGQNQEEAIYEIESYLDSALLNGYTDVYIIHGKGTGKLRIGIQEHLRKSRYIKSYRDGNMNEGGLGCTVVSLKS